MKLLKDFIRLIQAVLLLSIPLIILYWIILELKLELLKPFEGILHTMFGSLVAFIDPFLHFELPYQDRVINLTPLLLGVIAFCGFYFFMGIESLISNFESVLKFFRFKFRDFEVDKNREYQKMKMVEELAKNKVIYLLLKLRSKDSAFSYLYTNSEGMPPDNTSQNLTREILNFASKFNAKRMDAPGIDNDIYCFAFYNIDDAIDYSFYIYNRTIKINNDHLSSKLDFIIACHCAYSETTSNIDIPVADKILNLCGDNEILVSELFKNKYEALKEETNLKFNSKGIYNINNKQIEVFQIKVDPVTQQTDTY